ncbi:5'-3' exoribonuclease 1-like isoform X2 [Ptychodera flava]|uniref:5'-3' exoribonuclease 1-like isoform X2 n=1 Tax=Ptychodera flava TaxID=63121 RepID=UPI00396A12A3
MGVPKFYRWISERYPCLSEVVRENQIPEFDNLYLDMNGIIHICSHPNDDDPHFRISEEKIFQDIFHYIEVLFRIVKPRKVFFMAVDGVAPRAKMNQQRGRRFRSARVAEEQEKKALQKGETLPTEKRFDSNCITPGTEFMVKLQEQLKYFVNKKITDDKMWQGIRVYLSGHETPGEGEHKVMDFIRTEKSHPDYDPNTRHCLYGLDADLIMLGLTSHEPHFSLLREEVRFTGKKSQKRMPTPEETTFHLLHLSLFREYLEFEFQDLKGKLTFDFDLEKLIDDWVMMGFLVGNDFIPHLPDLHIAHDALPLLYRTYIDVLPTLDGYINEAGTLNLKRFEQYLQKLSQFDRDKFSQTSVDLKYFKGKKSSGKGGAWVGKRLKKHQEEASMQANGSINFANLSVFDALATTDEEDDDDESDDTTEGEDTVLPASVIEDEDEEEMFEMEFRQHKRDYYRNKLGFDNVTEEVLREQAVCYVTAIQWILHYYFNGVQSWSWYYPYHYAPFMSDIKGFSDVEIKIDRGKPFKPFQQLLAVLPAASKELLPKPYQNLMIMDTSPIIEYYPIDFKTDLNGKQQDWEAVVLIPFIDEERLLAAMDPLNKSLSNAEQKRNSHGPHLLYTYDEQNSVVYPSSLPDHFPDISASHARCTQVPLERFHIDPKTMRKGLLRGTKEGVYYPGFPTMKHIPHSAKLRKCGVKVFQMNSRNENMILTIEAQSETDIEKVAHNILGTAVFTGWPHLQEVRVTSVSDDVVRYELKEQKEKNPAHQGSSEIIRIDQSEHETAKWVREVQGITESYHSRKGVDIGQTTVLIHATPMTGRRYICGAGGVITLEKQWAVQPVSFALQTTVQDISAYDPSYKQFKTLEELFPAKSVCFMLGTPQYGCMGEVIEVDRTGQARIRVAFNTPIEPRLEQIISQQWKYEVKYLPGHILGRKLGISSHLVSRITGMFFVFKGCRAEGGANKINIGLNLKFNKKNKEVPGFTKKNEEDNLWLYSYQTLDLIAEYISKYPALFEYIAQNAQNDNFYEEDVFGEDNTQLSEIHEWLKSLPYHNVEHVPCGHKALDENVIKAVVEEIDRAKEVKQKKRTLKMSVKPYLLFRPFDCQGNLIPDPEADFQLFDRIINVREGYTVPLGLRGVVVGIMTADRPADVLYDVIFDKEFEGALVRSCGKRGYHMPPSALINISYGIRKEQGQDMGLQKPTAVVKPHNTDRLQQTPEHTQSRGWYSDVIKSAGSSTPDMRRMNSPRINHSPNSPFVPSQTYSKGRQNDISPHLAAGRQPSVLTSTPHSQNKKYYTPPSGARNQPLLPSPQMSSPHQPKNYQPSPRQQGQGSTSRQQSQKKDQPIRVLKKGQTPEMLDKELGRGNTSGVEANEFADMWKQLQESPSVARGDNATSNLSPGQPSLMMAAASLPMKSAQEERERMRKSGEYNKDSLEIQQRKTPHKKIQIERNENVQNIKSAGDESGDLSKLLSTLNVSTDPGTESTVTIVNSLEKHKVGLERQDVSTDSERQSPGTKMKLQEDTENLRKLLHIGSSELNVTSNAGNPQSLTSSTSMAPRSPYEPAMPSPVVSQTSTQPTQTVATENRPLPGVNTNVPNQNYLDELVNFCRGLRMPPPQVNFQQNPQGIVCIISLSNGQWFRGNPCRSQDEACSNAAYRAFASLVITGNQLHQWQYSQSPRQPYVQSPQRQALLPTPRGSVPVRMANDGVAIRSKQPHQYHQQGPGNMQTRMGSPQRQAFPQQHYQHPFPSPGHYQQQQQYQQLYQPHYPQQYPVTMTTPEYFMQSPNQGHHQSTPFVPLQVTRQQRTPNKPKGQGQGQTPSESVTGSNQTTSNHGQMISQTHTRDFDKTSKQVNEPVKEIKTEQLTTDQQEKSSKTVGKHPGKGRTKRKLAISFNPET